jgi:hypothetical protein
LIVLLDHNYNLFKKAFCSSISGALAAKAIFESVGVGDEKATAYGATLTWLIKGRIKC